MMLSGFTEIVQLLLDRATNSGCLKRMLDSVDAEGDTVSTEYYITLEPS